MRFKLLDAQYLRYSRLLSRYAFQLARSLRKNIFQLINQLRVMWLARTNVCLTSLRTKSRSPWALFVMFFHHNLGFWKMLQIVSLLIYFSKSTLVEQSVIQCVINERQIIWGCVCLIFGNWFCVTLVFLCLIFVVSASNRPF